jgi:hypothetical protein
MFKVIADDIYFKNVRIASFNTKMMPSLRDEIEQILKNNFYTEDEISEIKIQAISDSEEASTK